MKYFKSLIFIGLALFIYSCSGGGEDTIPEQTTEGGIPYRIVEEGDGPEIVEDNIVATRLKYTIMRNDSVFVNYFDKEDPQYFRVSPRGGYGDPADWFTHMSKGDSAHFYLSVDSMYQTTEPPSYLKYGDMIRVAVTVEEAMTPEEYQTKQSQEQMAQSSGQAEALKQKLDNAGITDVNQTPEGLYYNIEREGDGPAPQNGDVVKVHYVGRLFSGDTFDSSYKRGEPISFTIGKSSVIPGWHKGLPYFNKGSKGTLYIPPMLGYGEQGGGPIPPNANLIFDIEVVDVTDAAAQSKAAQQKLQSYMQQNNVNATKAPAGFFYKIEEQGSGSKPQPGQKVKVHYTGKLLDGTVFDSSRDRGKPFEFTLGRGQVIKGWDQGIQQFPVGSKGKLYIPPNLGYGNQAAGSIPPNSNLIFEIEVIAAE